MGGFFGVAKRTECINELFYGVDYNSHMGTKRAGIATCNNGVFTRSIHNIENSYFRSKFEGDLKDFTGNVGVGVISDTDAQPIIVNCHLGKFAIVTVGRINNIAELEKELLAKGHHFCEHSYDIINPTEMVAALICEGKDYVSGIENQNRRLDRPYLDGGLGAAGADSPGVAVCHPQRGRAVLGLPGDVVEL